MKIEQEIPAEEYEQEEEKKLATEEELDLAAPLKKSIIGGYINKKEMVGKTETYVIRGIKKKESTFQKGKWGLVLQLECEGENYLLDCGAENLNSLIDELGEVPNDWIEEEVKIKFEAFKTTTKKGEDIEGVIWKLI